MSKNWMMLTGLLLLGPVGTSQAQPLDSPDPVYIDGLLLATRFDNGRATRVRATDPAFVGLRSSPCNGNASGKFNARGA